MYSTLFASSCVLDAFLPSCKTSPNASSTPFSHNSCVVHLCKIKAKVPMLQKIGAPKETKKVERAERNYSLERLCGERISTVENDLRVVEYVVVVCWWLKDGICCCGSFSLRGEC